MKNYVHILSIGGIDCQFQVRLADVYAFFKEWNRVITRFKNPGDPAYIAATNRAMSRIVYKSMIKRGVWPFRKPYRSRRHMMRSLLKEEYSDFSNFVALHILNDGEDKKKAETPEGDAEEN
jgi:hypothetical protein